MKQALIDLEMFIETVDKKNINNSLNTKTIGPIFDTYFQIGSGEFTKKDPVRADLAKLLIAYSFEYLSWPYNEPRSIPDYEQGIIDNALLLSTDLASRMKYYITQSSTKEESL